MQVDNNWQFHTGSVGFNGLKVTTWNEICENSERVVSRALENVANATRSMEKFAHFTRQRIRIHTVVPRGGNTPQETYISVSIHGGSSLRCLSFRTLFRQFETTLAPRNFHRTGTVVDV